MMPTQRFSCGTTIEANDLSKQSRVVNNNGQEQARFNRRRRLAWLFRTHSPRTKSEQTSTSYLKLICRGSRITERHKARSEHRSADFAVTQLGFFNDVPRSGRARKANHD
jgi:hypothetical protein